MIHYLRALAARLRGLFGDRRAEQELDGELETHLRLLTERYVRQGMTADEAAWAARRKFGNVTLLQEAHRDMRGIRFIDTLFQDVRYGLWRLRRNPGFTFVALLTLALGIGANTAIFSVMNALLLRSLPVKDPQELALFSIIEQQGPGYAQTYPFYEMVRDHRQSFSGVIAGSSVGDGRLMVKEPGGGAVEPVQQQRVSGNFFSLLGAGVVVGRALSEADDNPASAQPGAVISYEFWRRRFDLDPGVVGRQVTVNDTALTIVDLQMIQ